MKKILTLLALAVCLGSALSACIIVPDGGGHDHYHDHY
jgi:starvation-inducible outer membrane lipoprotein